MASHESMKGSQLNRDSDENIRSVCKHYQLAAGIIQYIKLNILPKITDIKTQAISMSLESLDMVEYLMLAQAQLCFYEKAIRDRKAGGMKASIIAKLASQTAEYYNQANKLCSSLNLSRVLDPFWRNHTEYQQHLFEGASEYWMSIAVKDEAAARAFGFGEEIARLRKAERIIAKLTNLPSNNNIDTLFKTIISSKLQAESDNKSIYMESIPSESSLVGIEKISMVT